MKSLSDRILEKQAAQRALDQIALQEQSIYQELAQHYARSFASDPGLASHLQVNVRVDTVTVLEPGTKRRLNIKVLGENSFLLEYDPDPGIAMPPRGSVDEDLMLDAVIAFADEK